jgi:uncharacterized phage infection (PIP) family protein YhgE
MKEHKIIKYNLQDEVNQLKTAGMAYQEIASTIKGNHPEIADLSNLSAMAIQRYFSSEQEKDIEKSVKAGENPVMDFLEEYRKEMKDINRKSNLLYEKSMQLLNSIDQSDDDFLKLKAIKEVRDNLDMLRKNQVSLVEYGEKKTSTIYNVNLKKEIHVKNMLIAFNKNLCSKCRLKIAELLENEEVV